MFNAADNNTNIAHTWRINGATKRYTATSRQERLWQGRMHPQALEFHSAISSTCASD